MLYKSTTPNRLLSLGAAGALVFGAVEGCEGASASSESAPEDAPAAEAPAVQGDNGSDVEGTPLAAEPTFDQDAGAKNKRLRLDVVHCVGSSVMQIAPGVYDVEVQVDQPDARGVWVKVNIHEAGTESGFMNGTSGRIAVGASGSAYDRATLTTYSPYGDKMWVQDECTPVSIVDQP